MKKIAMIDYINPDYPSIELEERGFLTDKAGFFYNFIQKYKIF